MSAKNKLKIEISAQTQAATAALQAFASKLEHVTDRTGGIAAPAEKSRGAVSRLLEGMTALPGALAALAGGFAIKELAAGFLETGSAMDSLKASLDTITQGQGEETFAALNAWAMTMPVNTEKAIDSYKMMRAMGLRPAIDDMTTLVDTAAAIGGADVDGALEGISRALGQIKTKGKASSEELMQLAERGVPASEILQEKLGLTAAQVADIGNQGVSGAAAVEALLSGMGERFGGQSEKIAMHWSGLWASMVGYWTEFKRLTMDSGVMAFLEDGLGRVADWAGKAFASGDLQRWAATLAGAALSAVSGVAQAAGFIWEGFKTARDAAAWLGRTVSDVFGYITGSTPTVEDGFIGLSWAAQKIGDVFLGLRMIWASLEIGFAEFSKGILGGINRMLSAAQSVAGRLGADETAEELGVAVSYLAGQQTVWNGVIDKSNAKLEDLAGQTSGMRQMGEAVAPVIQKYQDLAAAKGLAAGAGKSLDLPAGAEPAVDKGAASAGDGKAMAAFEAKRKQALESYEKQQEAVRDRILQLTLDEHSYKVLQLEQWREKALGVAREAGQGTAEIEEAYRLQKAELESAEIEAHQRAQEGLTDQIKQRTLDEFEYKRYQLEQWRDNSLAIAEEIGRGTAEIEEAYRIQKAELDAADEEERLARAEDALAMKIETDAWNLSQDHQYLEALRDAWGLTWDEIEAKQVNATQEIASSVAQASQTAAEYLTDVATGAKSGGDAVKELFRNLLSSAVAAMVKIGAQQVIMMAVQGATTIAGAKVTAGAMDAITAHATPAAAATSIATGGTTAGFGASAFVAALGLIASAMKSAFAGLFGGAMATGGIVSRPTLALIGEAGPEAVIPLAANRGREREALLTAILPMAGVGVGGAGSSVTINISQTITIVGAAATAGEIGQEIGERTVDLMRGALQ